jgi:mannitol/fructose-specific phosphotransferase system IIA component (Ntr-type)
MIAEYISEDKVILNLEAGGYSEALNRMAARSAMSDPEGLVGRILQREKLMTTGLGKGIALPRVNADHAKRPVIIVGISPRGVAIKSIDHRPVSIIFLHIFPAQDNGSKILAQSLRLLGDENFRNELIKAATPEALVRTVAKWEQP